MSQINEPRYTYERVVSHTWVWCVWLDSLMCVTWLIHKCDLSHSWVWHDTFRSHLWIKHVTRMSRTWVRQVTLMNESCYTHESDSHTYKRFMSHWLMIAFITWNGKTIFSFAEYSLFYRALWQKRPIILRSLLICYPCLRVYVPQIHVDHTRVRHVTLINESCHTHEWDMSHLWMSHDTHMNETRHTYEWVMSHI